ncbi:hypothetical protein HK100_000622, partial [Physocladia obscura]
MQLPPVDLALALATAATAQSQTQFTVPVTRETGSSYKFPAQRAIADAHHTVNRFAKTKGPKPPKTSGLTNEENEIYVVNATFSDGNTFTLDFDTGSSDTWIRGPSCSGDSASCTGAAVNVSSAGITDLYASYAVVYGSGVSAGDVVSGTVLIGKAKVKITVGVTGFSGSDGLLGLGYSSLGTMSNQISKYSGISGNWFDASNVKNKVFSFYLSNQADGDNGEVTFGGYDTSKFTDPITWLPVVKPVLIGGPDEFLWWTFSLDS